MPQKKASPIVGTHFNNGIRMAYDTSHGQYTGYYSPKIKWRSERYYDDADQQFLRHFATVLKGYYSQIKGRSEVEVQIADINGRYIIGTNKNDTVDYIFEKLTRKTAKAFRTELTQFAAVTAAAMKTSHGQPARRFERHANKFQGALTGDRYGTDIGEWKAKGKEICVKFNVSDDIGADLRNFIEGNMGDARVAFVQSKRNMHAEQKILLGLCKAFGAVSNPIEVAFAGTFRECRGCHESLKIVQKYLLPNMAFGNRPGHFWRTTTPAHREIFQTLRNNGRITFQQRKNDFDANGLLKGLTKTTHRPRLKVKHGSSSSSEEDALHFDTDSDSEYVFNN